MEKYTVTAETGMIKVMAEAHRQHIWSQTTLVGVSKAGSKRLAVFMEHHADERITVNAGPYNPRLIGYETK